MTGFMLGMTISTVANYQLSRLPLKWWLVAISAMAVGCGLWAARVGPTRTIRGWCGALWAVYATIRAASWLSRGSWSGALPWVPSLLLGVVVFVRRVAPPHTREHHEREE